MKPLNLDNSPCTPISSNCVIWQGPNIPCIKLCTGDTVSDVVFKLATELCEILEQLNVSNYDLACLNLASCSPTDFQTLIQLLINKICDLENGTAPTPDDKYGGCPVDCIVEVAECFGGGTDNLVDYVDRIGKKICDLIDDITELTNQFNSLVLVTQNLQEQIDNLPVYTLPSIDPECQIGAYSSATRLDILFEAFLNDVWCPFTNVTGTSSQLSSAITSQCVTGANTALEFQYSLSSPANQLGVYYSGSWVNSPATIADAIKNIWIALCDVRKAGKEKTVVAAGTGVTVTSATAVVGNDQVTTYTVNTQAYTTVQDEGVSLPQRTTIDFQGAVTATDIGGKTVVTVPCQLFVNITDASTIEPPAQKATATVSGGVAPYSYQWSFGDWSTSPFGTPGYYQFVGATNTATVEYELNPLAASIDSSQYQLLKVIITDANGCKVSDTFLLIVPYVPA